MNTPDPHAETAQHVAVTVDYPWHRARHMHQLPAPIPESPLVEGGQGREAEDLHACSARCAGAIAGICVLAIAWAIVFLLLAIFGFDGGSPL